MSKVNPYLNQSDPYALLNIDKSASEEEVRQAYKQASRFFHPDKQLDLKESAQKIFIHFKNAHDILIDKTLRFAYDEYGAYGVHFIRVIRENFSKEQQKNNPTNSGMLQDQHYFLLLLGHLLQLDQIDKARETLITMLQYNEFIKYEDRHSFYCSAEFPCSTLHTQLFGEGYEKVSGLKSLRLPFELNSSNMSMMVEVPEAIVIPSSFFGQKSNKQSTSSDNKHILNAEFGGAFSVQSNGKASNSGKAKLEYQTDNGHGLSTELQFGGTSPLGLTFSTTRSMTNGTQVLFSLNRPALTNKSRKKPHIKTILQTPSELSFVTKRLILKNRCYSSFAIGMSSNRQFRFAQLSFTSLYPEYPKCTAILNLGLDDLPFKLNFSKTFYTLSSSASSQSNLRQDNEDDLMFLDNSSTLKPPVANLPYTTSLNLGFNWWGGMKIKTTIERTISKFFTLSMGIEHLTSKGLSWIFVLQRGSHLNITVPIHILSVLDPVTTVDPMMYPIKALYLAFVSYLLDATFSEYIIDQLKSFSESGKKIIMNDEDEEDDKHDDKVTEEKLYIEEMLLPLQKGRDIAMNQKRLMQKQAHFKREAEEDINGLVILSATYGLHGKNRMKKSRNFKGKIFVEDVTTQLQFWVDKSKLKLPAVSKSHLMGFYDIQAACDLSHAKDDFSIFSSNNQLYKWCYSSIPFLKRHFNNREDENVIQLKIRYKIAGFVYEITINDTDPLEIPSNVALKLGSSEIVL